MPVPRGPQTLRVPASELTPPFVLMVAALIQCLRVVHPDKLQDPSAELRLESEGIFSCLTEAYELFSSGKDPSGTVGSQKRASYSRHGHAGRPSWAKPAPAAAPGTRASYVYASGRRRAATAATNAGWPQTQYGSQQSGGSGGVGGGAYRRTSAAAAGSTWNEFSSMFYGQNPYSSVDPQTRHQSRYGTGPGMYSQPPGAPEPFTGAQDERSRTAQFRAARGGRAPDDTDARTAGQGSSAPAGGSPGGVRFSAGKGYFC